MPAINNWTAFWKTNPAGFNKVMRQSTRVFAGKMETAMPLSPTDNLLDLGCGPGYLIDFLKDRVGHIHGVDVSETYISICRERFAGNSKLSFSVAAAGDYDAYANEIVANNVNKIVVLSVLQYFTSDAEVKKMLQVIKSVARPGTQCLIADVLPTNHGFLADAFSVLINSIRRLYLFDFMKFMWYVTFSDYKNLKNVGMLHLDRSFFTSLQKELDIQVAITPVITQHPSRYSVLITF